MRLERNNYIYEIPEDLTDTWDGLLDLIQSMLGDGSNEYQEQFDEKFEQYKIGINPTAITSYVLKEVLHERVRQEKKWGPQNHRPADWLMILGEEVGECNQAALEVHFDYKTGKTYENLREELIQVAAVSVAIVESLDRNELKNH